MDDVIGTFTQDKVGALARGQHILAQIHQIDRLPNAVGRLAAIFI